MPKNQSYGAKVRDRVQQFFRALHDFDTNNLDETHWTRLHRQGMRTKRHNWNSHTPQIDFDATNLLLQDLSGLKADEIREALNLLERFIECLERFRTSQGRGQGVAKIHGRLTLWSTDVETNLLYFQAAWDVQRECKKGLKRLEPNLKVPNPHLLNSAPETPKKLDNISFSEIPQSSHPNYEAPQSDTPDFSEAPQSPHPNYEAPSEEPQTTPDESTSQSTAEDQNNTFNFAQFFRALRTKVEYSPAAHIFGKSIGAFFGVEPHAQVKPSDCQRLIQNSKNIAEEYYANALGPALSDHKLVFIEIGTLPIALQQYQNMIWENPQQFLRTKLLGSATRIVDQFHTITPQRRLLILGAPGSGKTIALIEIMRFLVSQAENDWTQPIPVLLQLSTYGHPPTGRYFRDWIVNRLELQYGIVRSRGRQFLNEQKLLLLLDGLDELRPQVRKVCINHINSFLSKHENTECVITSRRTEYEEIKESLYLDAAIELQPLDVEQAVSYLTSLPQAAQLQPLITAIQNRPEFQQLAETPLLLNVMAIAYQDITVEDLQIFNSIDDHRRYLFDVLISRLLHRQRTVDGQKAPSPKLSGYVYSQQEMIDWLIWLARHMVDHDQAVFYIEQLQPTWLDKRKQIEGYHLNSIALVGVTGGLSSACHIGINANWSLATETLSNFGPILGICMSTGISICWVFYALQKKLPKWLAAIIAASLYVTVFGVLAQGKINVAEEHNYIAELSPILLDWLVFVIVLSWLPEEIVRVSKAQWSWRIALHSVSVGLGVLLLLYAPARLLIGAYSSSGVRQFVWEVIVTVGLAAIIGGWMSGHPPDIETTTQPNQGIWIAARNALVFLGVIGLVGMVIANYYADNLAEYPMIALAIGIVAALMGGQRSGFVLIQHFVLRFMLWRNGCTPWNYQRFLNFAVKRMFLNKAGGGYLFMHRSFMEHLAAKYDS
ncbi:MAG: NACHT domain-containing protein [Cyanobacteria bacterium P01_G01_bin.54]